ncbi:MAG: hypothetical protein QOG01_920, partial [Pseudonocardiales bacterium]|nr:hypothetical protein [Pseudonocardiales bacterium]
MDNATYLRFPAPGLWITAELSDLLLIVVVMQDGNAVPGGVAAMPPGPQLGAVLAPIEVGAVPDEQLLEVLSAEWRQLAYQQGRVWAVMAQIATRDPMIGIGGGPVWTPEQVFESAVDEIRAELRLTRRSARRELEHADTVAAVPRVAQALRAGVLDRARAVVLAEGCADLTPEQAATLVDEVLAGAGAVTVTALAQRVRRVALALDPGWAERRYRAAVRERRVIGYLNEDGTATVSAQRLDAEQAAAAKRAGANAPIDYLRVELFLGLLDGRFHGQPETAIVTELLAQYPRGTEPDTKSPESSLPDNTQPENTGPDNTGSDNSQSDNTRSDNTRSDNTRSDNSQSDNTVPDGTEPDGTEPDGAEPDGTGPDGAGPDSAEPVPSYAVARRGVQVRVGLATLLGRDEQPGELPGWGTITAAVARTIAARQQRSEWRYAILDDAGRLLFDGLT